MSLLEKATLITTPTAHSNGKLHSIKGGAVADFDVVRGSAATRVNAEGLIEDISILSGELVSNGDFSNGSTGWGLIGVSTITGGQANIVTTSAVSGIRQSSILTVGKNYKLLYSVVSNNNGGLKISGNEISSAVGNNIYYFEANSESLEILRDSGITDITVTNISVVEVIDATNIPRIDYTTGEGVVLLEPLSTNLCSSSNALVAIGGGVVTPNAAISPDGTLNAIKVNFDKALNGGGLISVSDSPATASTEYTFSFYAKNFSGDGTFRVRLDTNSQSSLVNEDFTATSDWARYTHTFTTDAAASSFTSGSRFRKFADDNEVLFYGAQLEALPYATSYIPTSGAIASRLADSVTGAGDVNTFNSTEGVLYVEAAKLNDNSLDFRAIGFTNGAQQERLAIIFGQGLGQIRFQVKSSNSIVFQNDFNVTSLSQQNKIAFRYSNTAGYAFFINGLKVGVNTSLIIPQTTRLDFGVAGASFYGKVKALAVFNEALTDSELECLTKI